MDRQGNRAATTPRIREPSARACCESNSLVRPVAPEGFSPRPSPARSGPEVFAEADDTGRNRSFLNHMRRQGRDDNTSPIAPRNPPPDQRFRGVIGQANGDVRISTRQVEGADWKGSTQYDAGILTLKLHQNSTARNAVRWLRPWSPAIGPWAWRRGRRPVVQTRRWSSPSRSRAQSSRRRRRSVCTLSGSARKAARQWSSRAQRAAGRPSNDSGSRSSAAPANERESAIALTSRNSSQLVLRSWRPWSSSIRRLHPAPYRGNSQALPTKPFCPKDGAVSLLAGPPPAEACR